jgi:hypothetical protein
VSYELYLGGIQEVRWDKGDTIKDGDDICFYGRANKNHQLGKEFIVHHRTVSAAMTVKFDSDRMSYIVERSLVQYHYFECACIK